MKSIIFKVIGVMLLIAFLVYLFYSPKLEFDVLENPNQSKDVVKRSNTTKPKSNEGENPKLKSGVGTLVGTTMDKVTKKYGQADRTYSFDHDFKNYIFHRKHMYLIITAKNNKVKSVYVTGEGSKSQTGPIDIHSRADHLYNNFSFNTEPQFSLNGRQYHYELSDKDIKTQALIQFGDIYAQVFIDQQTNHVIGLRFLDKEALVAMNPYKQNETDVLTEDEVNQKEAHKNPDQDVNQRLTLYELTNEMRQLYHQKPLKVEGKLESVANVNLFNTLSTDNRSFTESSLMNVLDQTDLHYHSVSQNVAYNFNDIPTLTHSWMNSDAHRSRMLNEKYTTMGGEIDRQYFILIFLEEDGAHV
ncbi:CAP-associated domain-containing protein [Staphylococcus agnetis]|uniref:CAP domain-containing protein n=1 Tax=Staphylococcus agnetis TaxID=985762 RepID=UPI000D19D679|nr:CAP-associated domain-containing protein [Staphylococcus agnetis]PTH49044.1 SCP-like extracellular protein [Staphylococcus agnetis]